MPAASEATKNAQRRAVARHLIVKLRATRSEPMRGADSRVRSAGATRFMLFSTPLVRAILDGQKTATRRVFKLTLKGAAKWRCPFGEVGDRIWVREKWGYRKQFYNRRARNAPPFVYAADGEPEGAKLTAWKSSLYMPAEACPLVLENT